MIRYLSSEEHEKLVREIQKPRTQSVTAHEHAQPALASLLTCIHVNGLDQICNNR